MQPDYMTEWLEAGDTIHAAPCAHGGYEITVTDGTDHQWRGWGETPLDAMIACDVDMASWFNRLTEDAAVAAAQ
jgi:hypothetical protein